MADEVKNANVVRIGRDGPNWYALIGPDPQSGLMGTGGTPESALWNLADRVLRLGWVFDPSWQPRGEAKGEHKAMFLPGADHFVVIDSTGAVVAAFPAEWDASKRRAIAYADAMNRGGFTFHDV